MWSDTAVAERQADGEAARGPDTDPEDPDATFNRLRQQNLEETPLEARCVAASASSCCLSRVCDRHTYLDGVDLPSATRQAFAVVSGAAVVKHVTIAL